MLGKYTASFGCAVLFGLAVFVGMQALIAADGVFPDSDSTRAFLDFVRVDPSRDDINTKDRRLPDPPPPPETPPDAPDFSSQEISANTNLSMDIPRIGVPISQGAGSFLGAFQAGDGMSGFDTDVIPVVRVPPTYPQRARQARIEGQVTMAVTIRPDGSVADVEVIESNPPRLFDQAAVQAMQRWKFRPKIVGGQPVAQRARQTIEFSLSD